MPIDCDDVDNIGRGGGSGGGGSKPGPTPLESAKREYGTGKFFYEQGDLSDAEKHFNRALSFYPNYGPALTGIGKIREKQGRHQEAMSKYEAACDNNYEEGCRLKNSLEKKLKRKKEAEEYRIREEEKRELEEEIAELENKVIDQHRTKPGNKKSTKENINRGLDRLTSNYRKQTPTGKNAPEDLESIGRQGRQTGSGEKGLHTMDVPSPATVPSAAEAERKYVQISSGAFPDLEPLFKVTNEMLLMSQKGATWFEGKAADWLKGKAFAGISSKIPGVSAVKSLFDREKELFKKFRTMNVTILSTVFYGMDVNVETAGGNENAYDTYEDMRKQTFAQTEEDIEGWIREEIKSKLKDGDAKKGSGSKYSAKSRMVSIQGTGRHPDEVRRELHKRFK